MRDAYRLSLASSPVKEAAVKENFWLQVGTDIMLNMRLKLALHKEAARTKNTYRAVGSSSRMFDSTRVSPHSPFCPFAPGGAGCIDRWHYIA